MAVCAGFGGIEKGLGALLGGRYRTVGYVERDAYAASVIVARMAQTELDLAPVWDDVSTFDCGPWRGSVDLVTAGFPCQPFSTASRGRRVAVDLWPEVQRVIVGLDAPFAFLENVDRYAIGRAADQLQLLGYHTRCTRLGASDLGAPHQRPRWWLFAHHHNANEPVLGLNAEMARIREAARAHWAERPDRVLGMDDGSTYRVDRLRCLGNGVVPAAAAVAFAVLVGG